MADLDSESAFELFVMYVGGATRSDCCERFGVPQHRVFDRSIEARNRGKLVHPMLAHLPTRQGQGGGRPWHRSEPSEAEIWQRAAEVRSRR